MSKHVNFPAVQNVAYRGLVSEMRSALEVLARRLHSSPGAKADVGAQLKAVIDQYELPVTTLEPNPLEAVITDQLELEIPVTTASGTSTLKVTFTVEDGELTALDIAAIE